MSSRLFVGNLPYDATEEELREHFSQVGAVSRVFIPLDRDTGRPRGFAFIEFSDDGHALAAIERLHQKPFKGRPLAVNEARPNEARPSPAGRPPMGPRTPGTRTPPGSAGGPPPSGDLGERAPARRVGPKARKKTARRGWDEAPKKEPIPEKRRGQIFGGYDDAEEDAEDVDFENFATGASDSEEESDEEKG